MVCHFYPWLLLLPSLWEGMPNSLLEAMASGVPVVAMARGGHRFITKAGSSALIAQDAEEFIGLTVALARDDVRRAAMGANARADACERSWDSVFDGVYRSYRQAIELAHPQGEAERLVPVVEKQPSA